MFKYSSRSLLKKNCNCHPQQLFYAATAVKSTPKFYPLAHLPQPMIFQTIAHINARKYDTLKYILENSTHKPSIKYIIIITVQIKERVIR